MTGSRVIHSDDVPWDEGGQGDLFAHRRRRLGLAAGGQQLGCSMMELDPGKTAWPFHFHCANEEALFVLAGEATLRRGTRQQRVRQGDYVALPAGPADAHQLTNTGTEVVRYLVISTMVTPDVCVYPDADKVGIVGALRDQDGRVRRVVTFPRPAEVGYWDGETTTLDEGEPRSPEPGTGTARRAARAAQIDAQVEAELEALRRKVASTPSAASSEPPQPASADDPDDPDDPDVADLDALKRTLDRE
ncbi:MAG: cupin domain-containing protein [Nannocystaceae bacterium]